jgi:hypothetical protein
MRYNLAFLAMLLVRLVGAQTVVAPTNTWFTMLNEIKFAKKWSVSLETHERLGGIFKDQGQFLFRPSVDFHMKPEVIFSLGYTYINVQPYAPYANPVTRLEHNMWEQVLVKYNVGKFSFQNRLREENRWVDKVVFDATDSSYRVDGTTYANRLRFRWVVKREIAHFKNDRSFFFQGFDEIWINQNKNLMPSSFTRNWLFMGLGFAFSKDMNIQLGYMDQVDALGSNSFIRAPIIQTTFVWNKDLSKKKPRET